MAFLIHCDVEGCSTVEEIEFVGGGLPPGWSTVTTTLEVDPPAPVGDLIQKRLEKHFADEGREIPTEISSIVGIFGSIGETIGMPHVPMLRTFVKHVCIEHDMPTRETLAPAEPLKRIRPKKLRKDDPR